MYLRITIYTWIIFSSLREEFSLFPRSILEVIVWQVYAWQVSRMSKDKLTLGSNFRGWFASFCLWIIIMSYIYQTLYFYLIFLSSNYFYELLTGGLLIKSVAFQPSSLWHSAYTMNFKVTFKKVPQGRNWILFPIKIEKAVIDILTLKVSFRNTIMDIR